LRLLTCFPRFQRARAALADLAVQETLRRPDITSLQLAKLNALWQNAQAHVPAYTPLFTNTRSPGRFESLEHFRQAVPVLRKSQVARNPERFLSKAPAPGKWHFTAGSSGPPSPIYLPDQAHLQNLHAQYRFHRMWDIDVFDPKAFLWGHGASFAPGISGKLARLRQPIEDRLRNRLRLSSYFLGEHQLTEYLKRIRSFRPKALYGFSSALYLLAAEAARQGFECDSLDLVILTAEPAFPDIVQQVKRGLRVPVAIEYGATECAVIAHQWPDGTLRVREDMVIVETLPRDDGKYDIVLTILNNHSFPLIRYAIGDVTDAPIEQPDVGFAKLGQIIGRDIDLVKSRTGNVVHTAAIAALLQHYHDIRRFQVCQERNGAVAVQLEVNDPASFRVTSGLRNQLVDFVDGYPVTISVVDTIPSNTGGKHRWSLSELAHRG